MKIKYDVITKSGKQESWTGVFKNEQEAEIWFNKYGKQWESEGKTLVKVIVKNENKSTKT